MLRTYNQQYLNLCCSKPVKAYRLITEYLHGIAAFTDLPESTALVEIAKLYHETYQTLQNTYLYHGLLFKNMQAYKVYYQLYSKSYYASHLQSLDLVDRIMWEYEIQERDIAISLLLIKTAKIVLQTIPYVDPEPVLQYVLSKRTDKKVQERVIRTVFWHKHETDIKALYKQVNPFLTDTDIWFLYLMQPISTVKALLESPNTNNQQKNTKKKRSKSKQTEDASSVTLDLTNIGSPYSPAAIRELFRQWLQAENIKQTSEKRSSQTDKQTNFTQVDKPVKSSTSIVCHTMESHNIDTDARNVFLLP